MNPRNFIPRKFPAIRYDLTTRSYTDLARACAVPPAHDISRMGVVDINHKGTEYALFVALASHFRRKSEDIADIFLGTCPTIVVTATA